MVKYLKKGMISMGNFHIRDTSIKILDYLILQAVETGSLEIHFTSEEILKTIYGLDSKKLNLCLSYLYDSELLLFKRKDTDNIRHIKITSKAIDLIES